MGQYFKPANLTKKQYLNPHAFDDGLKLMEFAYGRTMAGLAILLADSNGRGGGDCRSKSPIIGSWAGDQIVITGDYADDIDGKDHNIYSEFDPEEGDSEWANISDEVLAALADDDD